MKPKFFHSLIFKIALTLILIEFALIGVGGYVYLRYLRFIGQANPLWPQRNPEQNLLLALLFFATVSILNNLVVLIIFQRSIKQRIYPMLHTLKQAETGNLKARIEAETVKDELSLVQQGINNLLDKQEETINTLEKQVKTRTGHLQTEIGERKQTEGYLRQRIVELAVLNTINQSLNTLHNLNDTLEIIVRLTSEVFDVPVSAIGLINRPENTIALTTSFWRDRPPPSPDRHIIPIGNGPEFRRIFNQGKPVIIDKIDPDLQSPPLYQLLKSWQIVRFIALPLSSRGQVIGVIGLGTEDPNRTFSDTNLQLGETIAGQIARAIDNAALWDEEQRQRHLVEKQNKELDAFAHTVAHDLKNPLTTINGMALAILETDADLTPQKRRHLLEHIVQAGQKSVTIIDELLLLATVRRQPIKIVPLDMAAILREAEKRFSATLTQEKGTISYPNHWETALGYPPWIEEVWANYLSNGLKYGGDPPHLQLGSEKLADHKIKFWVKDNGAGFSATEAEKLFTEFSRLNKTTFGGHGLGLSIVQRIIDRLNGDVGVESEPGQGSTFYFILPAADSAPTT